MKRVAIPISNNKLSEYFGRCSYYKIFEIADSYVSEKEFKLPKVKNIEELPAWASKKGITDIITYKIDKKIITLFNKYKINLFVGISIDTPESLINEFISERITSNNKVITEIMDKE